MSPLPCAYLEASKRLMADEPGLGDAAAASSRARGCAWLLRIALECALDEYWQRTCPPIGSCPSRRAQFLLLRRYVGAATARRTRSAWTELSRIGHHHCFDLAPSTAELSARAEDVADVIAALTTHGESLEGVTTS